MKCKYGVTCYNKYCKYIHECDYNMRMSINNMVNMNYIDNIDNVKECKDGVTCRLHSCKYYHKVVWNVRMDIVNMLDDMYLESN